MALREQFTTSLRLIGMHHTSDRASLLHCALAVQRSWRRTKVKTQRAVLSIAAAMVVATLGADVRQSSLGTVTPSDLMMGRTKRTASPSDLRNSNA
jgi:hypothetical protein